MDYMDQEHELAKHPKAKNCFLVIANDNKDAFVFLWSLWNWLHIYDDLIDKDSKSSSAEIITRGFMQFVVQLTHNTFFVANKDSLVTLLIAMANRYIDGDAWEKSTVAERKDVSQLLKCGDMDLYLHVAYLTGGWEHMRKCSREFRSYDNNFKQKDQ